LWTSHFLSKYLPGVVAATTQQQGTRAQGTRAHQRAISSMNKKTGTGDTRSPDPEHKKTLAENN
jgi:hypothetical protein